MRKNDRKFQERVKIVLIPKGDKTIKNNKLDITLISIMYTKFSKIVVNLEKVKVTIVVFMIEKPNGSPYSK